MTAAETPRLQIRDLTKSFAGTRALDAVDFDVRRGEVHALLGQNGSGKSTLIKVLAGFHPPDPGARIELDGEPVEIPDTAASRALGLRFVHQDLGLVHDLDTVENLALGKGYRTGPGGRILWKQERQAARERMEALGYHFDVRVPVRELGAAERTGVAIARALEDAENARILVVDEPTASLPQDEVEALFAAIDRVRTLGLGIIYVSHRLDEIFEIADRVTVLRDGHRVATREIGELDTSGLIALMIGDEEMQARGVRDAELGDVVLEARDLRGVVLDGIDLEVRRGEVVGLAGLTGSGREEALRMLFGGLPRGGTLRVDGVEVKPGKPAKAIAAGLALVPADRHGLGSVTSLAVSENCTMTDTRRYSSRLGYLSRGDERAEVRDWIRSLDVRPARPDAVFATLSGGNQQKIVLAKWLRMKPKALLLDEPTQGVDVHAKALIHGQARQAASDGAAVLIASSDESELCDVCDRVIVVRDGVIAGELVGDAITATALNHLQLDQEKAHA